MKINHKHRLHYRSRPWFPFLILAFGIVATLVSAYYVDHVADIKDRLLLDRSTSQIRELLERRFDSYTALLRGGAGLFATQQEITLSEFRQYVSLLGLDDRYKGVQGLGYSLRLNEEQKSSVIAYMQGQGITDFAIRPDTERDEYHTIMYLEPENSTNLAAIGADMFVTPERRAAMEKARDSGMPATSNKVTIPTEKDPEKRTGFLIYMPVYASPEIPASIEKRRELLRGFVFSPFRTGPIFSAILGERQSDLDIYIYDGDTLAESALLYSRTGQSAPTDNTRKALAIRSKLAIAGRTWTLYTVPATTFVNSFERSVIPFILSGGFMMSFVLYLLSRGQYLSRLRAEQLAGELYDSRDALEASEARLRRIIDANIIGVLFAKFDGSVYDSNDAFLKLIGYTKKELLDGKINSFDITPIEYRKTDVAATRQLKKNGSNMPYEKEYIRKDGTRVPILLGTAYIPGSHDEAISLVVDLTERKQLERQKDEFISIASHELKTPVTSLKAYAQVLSKRMAKKGDMDAAKHLTKMDNQLDKLTNLIKDLLDVTKIEAGKLVFKEDFFDLNELIAETVEEMQRTTERHRIVIDGHVTRKLYGDRDRIGQVVTNFLSNAIKYSPDAEKVIVSVKENKDDVTICVQDSGVGIPKEMQTKVFDRFFRVNDTRGKTFPGLGLGLFISADIIKRQKGKIWVESEVGKGSTFCFSIPFIVPPAQIAQEKK
jgi:PAS domain S-box-containing protein